jgi:hypothetical protein
MRTIGCGSGPTTTHSYRRPGWHRTKRGAELAPRFVCVAYVHLCARSLDAATVHADRRRPPRRCRRTHDPSGRAHERHRCPGRATDAGSRQPDDGVGRLDNSGVTTFEADVAGAWRTAPCLGVSSPPCRSSGVTGPVRHTSTAGARPSRQGTRRVDGTPPPSPAIQAQIRKGAPPVRLAESSTDQTLQKANLPHERA